jgi:serine/threonine protein kinase
MSLAVGTRIGPYEITGSLGAGGMGEVYRARDVRLARDVALKVLPESFGGDAERLARFQRIIVVQNWVEEFKQRVPVR